MKNDHYALVMEFAAEGSLDNLLVRAQQQGTSVCDEVLLQVGKQVCDGMIQLGVYNVVHGDLACRNLLVFSFDSSDRKQVRVKISDFGLSLQLTDATDLDKAHECVDSAVGPLRWMAPEVIKRKALSQQSDVWSFGVTLWELWTSCAVLPYASITDDKELRKAVLQGATLEQPQGCDASTFEIMRASWRRDPGARPDFAQLKEMIEDAFLMLRLQLAGGAAGGAASLKEAKGGECQICFSEQVEYAILPCGHKCLCSACMGVIGDQCPICRNDIREIVQLHLNEPAKHGLVNNISSEEPWCGLAPPASGCTYPCFLLLFALSLLLNTQHTPYAVSPRPESPLPSPSKILIIPLRLQALLSSELASSLPPFLVLFLLLTCRGKRTGEQKRNQSHNRFAEFIM
eukprot:140882-Hanusia_phi.AAC.2